MLIGEEINNYKRKIGIIQLINSFETGIKTSDDLCTYLGISMDCLNDALTYYKDKHNNQYFIDTYYIRFEPFGIMKMF